MTRLLFSCRSAAVLSLAEWLKGLWEQSREWIHQLQWVDCCLLVLTEYKRNAAFLLCTPSRSASPLLIKRIQSQMHGHNKKVLISVKAEPVLGWSSSSALIQNDSWTPVAWAGQQQCENTGSYTSTDGLLCWGVTQLILALQNPSKNNLNGSGIAPPSSRTNCCGADQSDSNKARAQQDSLHSFLGEGEYRTQN